MKPKPVYTPSLDWIMQRFRDAAELSKRQRESMVKSMGLEDATEEQQTRMIILGGPPINPIAWEANLAWYSLLNRNILESN